MPHDTPPFSPVILVLRTRVFEHGHIAKDVLPHLLARLANVAALEGVDDPVVVGMTLADLARQRSPPPRGVDEEITHVPHLLADPENDRGVSHLQQETVERAVERAVAVYPPARIVDDGHLPQLV